ncbi:MAG TPA: hypothetical protein VMZ02_04180 [Candidatus Limnocylindrales bacterium]|nr:hypothetical protein [Candidatus Limnocylindrales bacterium]
MGRKSAKTAVSKDNRDRQPFWVKDNNGPRMQLDERAMAIFQPDVLIESQYLATQTRRVHLDAERVLMFAVLRDAVSCFQDNVGSDCKRKQAMHRDAEEWILDKDRSHLFSFDNVCEILGLDPEYMRAGLLRWKDTTLRGRRMKARSLAG